MRACAVEGCVREYRAKGYCAGHYNQILKPDRHTTNLVCAECGKTYTTTRTNGKYCSLECRDALARVARSVREAERETVRLQHQAEQAAQREARRAQHWSREERTCSWCGAAYLAVMPNGAYCSHACIRKAGRARRRAREASASGTYTWCEVTKVYLSLDRQCTYCQVQVNEFEPDHVIPLSKGGSNSITNVVPACHACNCDKRDLLLSDWYVDRERRGLPPRLLDVRIKHLTHALLVA